MYPPDRAWMHLSSHTVSFDGIRRYQIPEVKFHRSFSLLDTIERPDIVMFYGFKEVHSSNPSDKNWIGTEVLGYFVCYDRWRLIFKDIDTGI